MTTTTLSHLFVVKNRRTFTPEYLAKWPRPNGLDFEESSYYAWGDDAESVLARINANRYEARDYRDDAVAADLVDDAMLSTMRQQAAAHPAATRYPPCCGLAVVRFCVCAISYTCPVHGTRCNGSHD